MSPSLRFHRCKPGLIEEVALQVDQTDRTRVREHFNKGYYMLSINFGVSSIGLPYAGFTADYLKLILAPCPLRTSKTHSPFVDVGLTRRDRKLAGRATLLSG